MFEAYIIGFWVEINSQLYEKTIPKIYKECEPVVQLLHEAYADTEHKLVAVKCYTFKEYQAKQEYFNGKR